MSNITYFKCVRCEASFDGGARGKAMAEKLGDGLCAECRHLEALGVSTVAEHNAWLRNGVQQNAPKTT